MKGGYGYSEYLSNIHENISDSRLLHSEVYPYLGASPDGTLECSCCDRNQMSNQSKNPTNRTCNKW